MHFWFPKELLVVLVSYPSLPNPHLSLMPIRLILLPSHIFMPLCYSTTGRGCWMYTSIIMKTKQNPKKECSEVQDAVKRQ